MAATHTPNLNLNKPDRQDYVSVIHDINDNMDKIDEEAGMVDDGIAIVIDGNTAPRAISSGQYLLIKNHSTLATGGYHATANIANGESVTSSNVAVDSDGIANALNSKIDAVDIDGGLGAYHVIQTSGTTETVTVDQTAWYAIRVVTGSTAADCSGYIWNSSNSLLMNNFGNPGAWGTIFTPPLFIKAGTTIKVQASFPSGGGGTLLRYT